MVSGSGSSGPAAAGPACIPPPLPSPASHEAPPLFIKGTTESQSGERLAPGHPASPVASSCTPAGMQGCRGLPSGVAVSRAAGMVGTDGPGSLPCRLRIPPVSSGSENIKTNQPTTSSHLCLSLQTSIRSGSGLWEPSTCHTHLPRDRPSAPRQGAPTSQGQSWPVLVGISWWVLVGGLSSSQPRRAAGEPSTGQRPAPPTCLVSI